MVHITHLKIKKRENNKYIFISYLKIEDKYDKITFFVNHLNEYLIIDAAFEYFIRSLKQSSDAILSFIFYVIIIHLNIIYFMYF